MPSSQFNIPVHFREMRWRYNWRSITSQALLKSLSCHLNYSEFPPYFPPFFGRQCRSLAAVFSLLMQRETLPYLYATTAKFPKNKSPHLFEYAHDGWIKSSLRRSRPTLKRQSNSPTPSKKSILAARTHWTVHPEIAPIEPKRRV